MKKLQTTLKYFFLVFRSRIKYFEVVVTKISQAGRFNNIKQV